MKPYRPKRTFRPIHLILLALILTSLMSGAGAVAVQLFSAKLFGWEPTVVRLEAEYAAKPHIRITATNIPLVIHKWDEDYVKIRYTGEIELITEEGETYLNITQESDFTFSLFAWDMLEYGLEAWLPEREYTALRLVTTTGDITLDGYKGEQLAVESVSGDITLSALDCGGYVQTGGRVEAAFSSFTRAFAVTNTGGSVSLTLPQSAAVWLEFLSAGGSFTSEFFRKSFDRHEGDLFMSIGENPVKLTIQSAGAVRLN